MSEQCALGPDCPVHLGNPCEHSVGKCVHCMKTVYPAAGPWRKWPEEKPEDWTRCIVEHTYDDGEPFYCVEVIGKSTPFVKLIRWAEILPPSKP